MTNVCAFIFYCSRRHRIVTLLRKVGVASHTSFALRGRSLTLAPVQPAAYCRHNQSSAVRETHHFFLSLVKAPTRPDAERTNENGFLYLTGLCIFGLIALTFCPELSAPADATAATPRESDRVRQSEIERHTKLDSPRCAHCGQNVCNE